MFLFKLAYPDKNFFHIPQHVHTMNLQLKLYFIFFSFTAIVPKELNILSSFHQPFSIVSAIDYKTEVVNLRTRTKYHT